MIQSNIRPGRSVKIHELRILLSRIRTVLIFFFKMRYAKRVGFQRLNFDLKVWSPNKDVKFGNKVQIGTGGIILNDINFANNILVGKNVSFIGKNDHTISRIGSYIWDNPRGKELKTIIHDDVWIGHGAIILGGVEIERGAVVAAGSVVTKNVHKYSVVGGNPAKFIKNRFTPEEIEKHENLLERKYNVE